MNRPIMIPKEKFYQLYVIESKTMTEIAQIYNVSLAYVSKKIHTYDLKENVFDKYINKKFGKLTVIKSAGYDKKSHPMLECLCDCGKVVKKRGYSLLCGDVKSCGCDSRKRGRDHKNYAGYEEISSSLWSTIKHHAKTRNIDFQLTIQEIWELFLKQNRKCALTGIELFFADTRKKYNETTASLDRINSKGIYEISNVQWIHKKVNTLKWDLSTEELIKWCQLITNYNTGKVEI